MSQAKTLIQLAEALALNLQLEEFELERLRTIANVNAVGVRLVHFINHFIADADIRAKDNRYARIQQEKLVELIQEMRASCNLMLP